jgi:hypothetical protein
MTRVARNADCRSQRGVFTPHVFLAMRLLTGQYVAKNQHLQEK